GGGRVRGRGGRAPRRRGAGPLVPAVHPPGRALLPHPPLGLISGPRRPATSRRGFCYTLGMSSDDAPKSAYELAMERLRKKDQEAGADERPLTDAQRAAIAQARQVHNAKGAQLEILHHAALRKPTTPDQ